MEPFLGEIRMMAFGVTPRGWALCNGQLMAINQNQALFALLGTTYGGDGRTTFALPDLRGRAPVHVGSAADRDITQGQRAASATTPATNRGAETPGGLVISFCIAVQGIFPSRN